MTPETFCEHFSTFAEAPNGVAKLRELIMQLAIQGKLGTHDVNEEPASVLRSKILAKRKRLVESGEFTAFATDTEWPDGALPYSLPNGWEWIRLGELGGFLGGGTPSKERAEFWDGKIPWVSPKDMKRPYMDDAIDHVSPLGVENSSGKMIPKGSLLMVVRGMILAHSFPVALAMRELTINQDMKAMQLALPELGEYMLRCCVACKSLMLASVERSSHGTCRLPTEAVANFPIPLPPLAEQRRIVLKVDQLLGLCDELAARQAARREARSALVGATLDRLVSVGSAVAFPSHSHRLRDHFDRLFDTPTTLPQLRQAILQLAVQGQLVPQNPNDEPASKLIDRIVAQKTDLIRDRKIRNSNSHTSRDAVVETDELPYGWSWVTLDAITEIGTGGTPPTGTKEYYQDGTIPWITSSATNSEFIAQPEQFITQEAVDACGLKIYPAGSLVVALYGQGKTRGQVGQLMFDSTSNQACAGIRFFGDGLEIRDYVRLVFRKKYHELRALAAGGAQPNLNGGMIRLMRVPLPPLYEQKRIVSKVTELLSLCDALEAKLTQAESASTQLLSAAVHHLLKH